MAGYVAQRQAGSGEVDDDVSGVAPVEWKAAGVGGFPVLMLRLRLPTPSNLAPPVPTPNTARIHQAQQPSHKTAGGSNQLVYTIGCKCPFHARACKPQVGALWCMQSLHRHGMDTQRMCMAAWLTLTFPMQRRCAKMVQVGASVVCVCTSGQWRRTTHHVCRITAKEPRAWLAFGVRAACSPCHRPADALRPWLACTCTIHIHDVQGRSHCAMQR